MSRAIAVFRPEPGNAATAARLVARGATVIRAPLFETRALAWRWPAGAFDAMLLTSANAVRFTELPKTLPVLAVGEATAAAARAAGHSVALTGTRDAGALIVDAERAGFRRLIHLGACEGRVRVGGIVAASVPVYAAEPLPLDPAMLSGCVAMLHSARAAERLALLVPQPAKPGIALAALSPAILAAARPGWQRGAAVASPDDAALVELALALAD